MTAPILVLAATSARMLSESARRGGFRPIALDVFGDVDTRRAARWIGIGNRTVSTIDSQRVHAVMTRLASFPRVRGWIAGGGFEDRLELLQECARTLTLLGNEPSVVRAAKHPPDFFSILDRHGIEHPETSLVAPDRPAGWLAKRVGGTGGWHVRRLQESGEPPDGERAADAGLQDDGDPDHGAPDHGAPDHGARNARGRVSRGAPRAPRVYFQREETGTSMSALFLANGVDAQLIGCNQLLTGSVGARSFVFHGAVGPVTLPASSARAIRHAVACVARHLGLKGLNSLDFLLEGERVSVIEVNPRPSATMELHDHRVGGGLVNAHLLACTERVLPPESGVARSGARGMQVVYARRSLTMSRRACQRLQSLGWCHDIGREGTRSGPGDPLCSISAAAESPAAVIALLRRRAHDLESIYGEDNER